MKELLMILRKEFIHILRDRITLLLVLAIPIVLVLFFGFTISTEIKNAKISVLDLAKDSKSTILINKIAASGYFQIVSFSDSESGIDYDFKNKNIKLAIIIPANFENSLEVEKKATIQIISDVSDINVASVLNNYIRTIINDFVKESFPFHSVALPFEVTVQMAYNPELKSVYMFVPGIIALIMIIVTALMTSITLAREKETGTMRMLFITPTKKIYVVIGKIVPYMLLSFLSTIMIIMLSVWIFKMPIEGNIWFLLFLCIVFMLTSASFGMIISAVVKTQLDAMMVTMMGLFLPTVLLSGFLFPLDNMPQLFQVLAHFFPAKWFIIAVKDVMIKGSGFAEIWKYLLILLTMASLLITISLIRINKKE